MKLYGNIMETQLYIEVPSISDTSTVKASDAPEGYWGAWAEEEMPTAEKTSHHSSEMGW